MNGRTLTKEQAERYSLSVPLNYEPSNYKPRQEPSKTRWSFEGPINTAQCDPTGENGATCSFASCTQQRRCELSTVADRSALNISGDYGTQLTLNLTKLASYLARDGRITVRYLAELPYMDDYDGTDGRDDSSDEKSIKVIYLEHLWALRPPSKYR